MKLVSLVQGYVMYCGRPMSTTRDGYDSDGAATAKKRHRLNGTAGREGVCERGRLGLQSITMF